VVLAPTADVLPPDPRIRPPKQALPPNSVDCHAHIFDQFDRYPLSPDRKYTPALSSREAWLALHAALGVAHGVQVHGTPYGFDNRLTVDFLTAHPGRFVGIAAIHPDMSAADLKALDAAGFRGARLMDQFASGATTRDLESIARRIAPLGWHIEINIADAADWVTLEPRLRACPVPLVFDHLGRIRGRDGVNSPAFRVIQGLLESRADCWTKISSWYRLSDDGSPDYDDMRPIAQALLRTRPDRCVWGSNWPHPGLKKNMPNDADLVDLLDQWLPESSMREPLFASNAAQLYRL